MCGIVVSIMKKDVDNKAPLKDVFGLAKMNRHRGENDGFGYIDLDQENMKTPKHNARIKKTVVTFKEFEEDCLDEERLGKFKHKKNKKLLRQSFEQMKDSIESLKSNASIVL